PSGRRKLPRPLALASGPSARRQTRWSCGDSRQMTAVPCVDLDALGPCGSATDVTIELEIGVDHHTRVSSHAYRIVTFLDAVHFPQQHPFVQRDAPVAGSQMPIMPG